MRLSPAQGSEVVNMSNAKAPETRIKTKRTARIAVRIGAIFRLIAVAGTAFMQPGMRAQGLPSVNPAGCPTSNVCITTWMYQPERDGLNLNESTLTSSLITGGNFHKKFAVTVDDSIYAEPLYLPQVVLASSICTTNCTHDMVIVATENAKVYAFDAGNGTALWSTQLLDSLSGRSHVNELTDLACMDIAPDRADGQHYVGVTGTPVIDLTANILLSTTSIKAGTMYVVTPSEGSTGTFYQTLFALDVTSGAVLSDIDISLTAPSGSTYAWDALDANQRGALLFQNGNVYVPFGSHCDSGGWAGWLASYTYASGSFGSGPTNSWLVTPAHDSGGNNRGGIWGAGAGPAGDEDGSSASIFATTGNGAYDIQSGSSETSCVPVVTGVPCDYSNSIVKLDASLSVKDYFTPGNESVRTVHDFDLGSGGALIVPTQTSGNPANMLVQGGKEGDLFLINRDTGSMGGYSGVAYQDLILQGIYGKDSLNGGDPTKGLCYGFVNTDECGMWSSPAWWNGGNTTPPYESYVYVGPMGNQSGLNFPGEIVQYTLQQTGSPLKYQLVLGSTTSDDSLAFPGTTPVISAASSGTTNAVLWYINSFDWMTVSGTHATLRAYDAASLGTGALWTSGTGSDAAGPPIKFTIPTVANGRVYVGGFQKLTVYGGP